VQAVTWHLRYLLSCRDLESIFAARGFDIDHSTISRWALACAPMIEKRLRRFRRHGGWLVTAKSFHIERRFEGAAM
jgi:transposase, IS6 family